MKLEGQVKAVSDKTVNTKRGPAKVYSVRIEDKWVNCGFKKPPMEKGEYVAVEVNEGAYGLDLDSDSPINKSGASESAPSTGTSVGRTAQFPVPNDDRGITIARQNALTAAVNLYTNFEGVDPDANHVDRIIEIASRFSKWTTGRTETEAAEELMEQMFPGYSGDDQEN